MTFRDPERAEPEDWAERVRFKFAQRMKASATERDWPSDYDQENGCYSNLCCECGEFFTGHERRAMCRVCASEASRA